MKTTSFFNHTICGATALYGDSPILLTRKVGVHFLE